MTSIPGQTPSLPDTKTILLADDDVDFAEALRLALETAGYRVITAHTAQQATALLQEQRVDLAVLDMMMEETDAGIILAHHLRRQPETATIPIILLTAVTEATGFRVSLDNPDDRSWLKVDAWADKPVDTTRLLQEIRRLIGP